MAEFTMDTERVPSGNILKQKEAVCMTRSDSMSIGSVGSDAISVGCGSEEMDTEDSEKDLKECILTRKRFASQEMQQNLSLPLDNRDAGYDLERIKGDVTSPVIENKLSDDVSGYYAMRTSLLSQSAVILENGAAVGNTRSGSYEDANCNVGTPVSGTRSSSEIGKTWKAFHTGYSSGSESEEDTGEGWDRSMVSMDDKHDSECFNSKQEGNNECAADLEIKKEPLSAGEEECRDDSLSRSWRNNLEVKTEPLSDSEGYRDDSFSKMREDEFTIKTEPDNSGECNDISRGVSLGILDADVSDSMAEVEKFGLQAKLARVSKRRIYSRARDIAHASDSSSESDSDDESEDDEEEKEVIFEDLHSAKVLVNAAQPDSEKLIEREVMKMACMDDLLSDCVSTDDSSEDSSEDSSSGESSDSDDSSDTDLSSADDSEDEAEEEEEEEEGRKPVKGRQSSAVSKEGLEKGLPDVEYLDITLPPSVELTKVGQVSSIIGSLVIIQADPGSPALNVESVLFKPDRTALGQIYDLFGPVVSPFYSVRFNNAADIDQQGIKLKSDIFFAPKNVDVTQYVFTEQLKKQRGSDASWKNDEECPPENADFSDDESELMARNKKKNDRRRKVPQGRDESFQQGRGQWRNNNRHEHYNDPRNQPRPHPPLQRQPAFRPPQFGPPKHYQHQQHQYRQRFQPRQTNQWVMPPRPPRGDFPFAPQGESPFQPPPRPTGGFQPGGPPMFQNPQVTETPQSELPVGKQQGFSALKTNGRIPARQKTAAQPVSQGAAVGLAPSLTPGAPPPMISAAMLPQQPPNIFMNPPSPAPVQAPFPGFNLFSIPPPPLLLPPPPPPGMSPSGGANDHAQTPSPLMTQHVHPPASTQGQVPWNHSQANTSQTQSNPDVFNPPPPPPGVSPQRVGHAARTPTPLMEEEVHIPPSTKGQAKWNKSLGHATQTPINPTLGIFSPPPPPPGIPPGVVNDPTQRQMQWNSSKAHLSQKQFNPNLVAVRATTPVSTSNFAPPPIPPPSFHPRMMQSFKQDTKTTKS